MCVYILVGLGFIVEKASDTIYIYPPIPFDITVISVKCSQRLMSNAVLGLGDFIIYILLNTFFAKHSVFFGVNIIFEFRLN